MLDADLYKIPTEIKSTGITEAIMGSRKVNFTITNALDTAVLQFTALVLSLPSKKLSMMLSAKS